MLNVINTLIITSSLGFINNFNYNKFNTYLNTLESEEYIPFKYKPRPKIIINEDKKNRNQNFNSGNVISLSPLISVAPKKRAKNIAYNSLEDIVSANRNKLITLYSTTGCNNWHNKINSKFQCEEYYAACLTCTWNDYSKAFIQTLKQIHGYQKIDRDPPFTGKKPPPQPVEDVIKEYYEEKRIYDNYILEKKSCIVKGLEPPPKPDFRPIVTFNKSYPYDYIQTKVLDYVEKIYKINFIEPDYWRIAFNKHFNKMYNMFHNEIIKRKSHHQNDESNAVESNAHENDNKLINFLLVPLTDSQLIKNKNKLNHVFKRKMYSNAKKIIFHEIVLKLLLENNIKYSDMPIIMLYKIKSDYPYSKLITDGGLEALDAARLLDYKCKKLILNNIFSKDKVEFIGKIDGFSSINPPSITELDELVKGDSKIPLPWDSTPLDPLLSLFYISYQYHLRKLLDDQKPTFYYQMLNPRKRL